MSDQSYFEGILRDAFKAEAEIIYQEEAEKAAKEVERRLRNIVDKVALSVLREYDIQSHQDRILISVRKQ